MKNIKWLFLMAWRDSKKSRKRIILFTSAIVMGIAAMTAINSFKENLSDDIDNQAKELLGADLTIRANKKATDSLLMIMDTLGNQKSQEVTFVSMAYFQNKTGTRLVNVHALEGGFPFYGAIETKPGHASSSFRKGRKAIVDKTLMLQFGLEEGDSITLGKASFAIEGAIQKISGQNSIFASAAPPVYIPMNYLEETGLIRMGSRVNYYYHFTFPENTDVDLIGENLEEPLNKKGFRYDTVSTRKARVGFTFRRLNRYLGLTAFVALLLGCIGVAGAVHVYAKEKRNIVAVLRCLGAKGSDAFMIYLIQIVIVGFLGAVLGAVLGSALQVTIPQILKGFLPVDATFSVSYKAIIQGIVTGTVLSLLFAIMPLIEMRNIAPLQAIRNTFVDRELKSDIIRYIIFGLIALAIFFFAYVQLSSKRSALGFTVAIFFVLGLLSAVAKLVMWLSKKYFPNSLGYVWRQGLANLFRPNNQTLILIVIIGLGTTLITTLLFVQSNLLNQVSLSGSETQPNMMLIDIQPKQKEKVTSLTSNYNMPVLQEVPIVTMRVLEVNGNNRFDILEDSTIKTPLWAYNREYRVTYRDELTDTESVVAGEWKGNASFDDDSIFVSVEERHAERLGVEIGDELIFNVQGAQIKTYVGSLRQINWNKIQTNFLVLFPRGILEEAPQFYVMMTKTPNEKVSAGFQQDLVKQLPTITVIDLNLALSTIDDIVQKVSFVIRFMAMFSILTGIVVLISSISISKLQRIRESVLLRTLGANRKQIRGITALEYLFLGALAAISGTMLSLPSSWLLAYFVFKMDFTPDILPILIVIFTIASMTTFIGVLNNRKLLNKPPLEVLREVS